MKFTPNQLTYLRKLQDARKCVYIVTGPAGTGKTALACRHASKLLKNKTVEKLVITKPAVSVDEEHGYLPGTLRQKMTPWLLPIMDSLEENLEKTKVESLINQGKIEIAPIAYMRGRTFKNSFIIADEMQNSTPNQMKMVMTRLGEGSNIVITGDTDQNDRNVENGLLDFVSKIRSEEEYQYIERIILENSDIKRHPAIVEILDIYL